METQTQEAAISEVVRVLRRRWPLVVVCLVLAAGSAVAFSLLQQKQYTASAQLLFRSQTFDQQLFGNNFVAPQQDPAQEAATNQHLVQLPIVSQRTAAAIGGKRAGNVAGEVAISTPGQANIAVVSATDPSPELAARIANTYAAQYVLFRQQADRQTIARAQRLVQTQLAGLTPAERSTAPYLSLTNRAQQLQILASLQTGNAEFVQPATVPRAASVPKTKRNGLLGAVLGLLLGLGLAFLVERLDRRIHDAESLEATFGVPLLGVIPESAAYEQAPTTVALPHAEMEAFALLRARLRYFNVDRELRSLLITSAAPQDGKSTVSMNLAFAEAAGGKQEVVLVEADLRRPTLAARLGIERGPGLAEVLSGNASLDTARQIVALSSLRNGGSAGLPSDHDTSGNNRNGAIGNHFTVIAAGAIPPNPAELIESRAMVDLLARLGEQFDLIVIDSPPAQTVADAMHLMRLVDGVVVVSRVGKNTRDMARHLRDQLRRLKAPILGVVANAVSSADRGYAQYGYYAAYASETVSSESPAENEPVSSQSPAENEPVSSEPLAENEPVSSESPAEHEPVSSESPAEHDPVS